MKVITNKDVESLNIKNSDFLTWATTMIQDKPSAYLPAKISMKPDGHNFYNVMPSILQKYSVAGVKVVTRYMDRTPSLRADILLYDYTNGDLKAIVDGTYITKMRTGAVAAHTILTFAKSDYQSIALIGLGEVMQATADILFEQVTNKNLSIKLYRYKDHAEKFIERYAHYKNLNFTICDSYKDAVTDSDIIISGVTYAEQNFCTDDCFKQGCLVVPIHSRGFQNCDLFFDKVYGDDRAHVCGFQYFDRFKSFGEVCDVVNGKIDGRQNDNERILVYNIGISIHDIYAAQKIYERFEK